MSCTPLNDARTAASCARSWNGTASNIVEYDVEADEAARLRLLELVGGDAMVPVLVEDGGVSQVGVGGRGCYVGNR